MSRGNFRMGTIFGVLLTGAILYALITWAHAALVELRWINLSDSETATQLRACVLGDDCSEYFVDCGPGGTCETLAELPVGELDVWLHAATDDPESWSGPSNVRTIIVNAPAGCEWDFDENGIVSSSDFADFLPGFGVPGGWTMVDFSRFLSAFGTSCV